MATRRWWRSRSCRWSRSGTAAASAEIVDRFADALWIEDGLAANTLSPIGVTWTLYAEWLAAQGRTITETTEADLFGYAVARHAGSRRAAPTGA